MNVEEGLLLSGEARVWKILGRCAAAHGHVAIGPILLLEQSISFLNSLDEVGGRVRPESPTEPERRLPAARRCC